MPKSQFLADTLKTFLFSLSQGLGASAGARGRQGTNLGMAAALGAPMQLQEMERQRRQQEEERARLLEAAKAATRRGEIEDAVKIFNVLKGMETRSIPVNAPVATPSPIGTMDGGTFQPPTQGGGQMGVMTPNPSVNIPGVGSVTPPNAQQVAIQKMQELRQAAQLEQEMAPPPGFDPFNTPGGTINKNNPQGGFVPGTTPQPDAPPKPTQFDQMLAAYNANPELVQKYGEGPIGLDKYQQDQRVQAALASRQGTVDQRSITRADAKVREFLASPAAKKYAETVEIQDYVSSFPVDTAGAPDDYTLLVTHAKAIDPGSVAREGEVKAASMAAQSLLDQFGINAEAVINRKRGLTVAARKAIIGAIERKIAPTAKQYESQRQFYREQIGKIPGLDLEYADDTLPNLGGGKSTAPAVGDTKTFPNGKQGRWDGRGWIEIK